MKSSHLLFSITLCLVFFLPLSVLGITVDISATVPGCGEGVISGNEQCEGSDLGGASCTSQGFTGGLLSCTSACTFNTSQCTPAAPSSGGGGGNSSSSPSIPDTNVVFSGKAYPLSRVSILKDGQMVVTTLADSESNFTATISGLSTGHYLFAVYGEDHKNLRSSLFTFPIFITSGVTTKIGSIFIAPTIAVDKSEVKQGDTIAIFGQSTPTSEITLRANADEKVFMKHLSDASGAYEFLVDTASFATGQHFIKSQAVLNGEVSSFSQIIGFNVGAQNIPAPLSIQTPTKGDLNNDQRINLVDFSIMAYWFKRPSPPTSVDLTHDGKVDLIDFSILAFFWTG